MPRTKKNNKNNRQHKPQGQMTQHNGVVSLTRATPDELDIWLSFRTTNGLYSAGVGATTKSYNPNAAYDVDPALGSTETAGFDEYAHLYTYYRVIEYKYEVEFFNTMTSTAAVVYVLNTNTAISGSSYDILSANPYCQRRLLATNGNAASYHKMSGTIRLSKLVGSNNIETADSFRSVTTTTPTDLVYLTLVANCVNGLFSSNGVNFTIEIKMKIRFFARNWDLTLASLTARLKEHRDARERHNLEKKQKFLDKQ
jgi:hypothetical protein